MANKMKYTGVILVFVMLVVSVLASPAFAKDTQNNGQPFEELWDAIGDLWDAIGEIELTPGPPGPKGDTGAKGDTGDTGDTGPKGAIMMWSGTIGGNGNPVVDGTPDTNWHICDGTSGTPDLTDRFIVGAGSSYSVGDTGGENTHTLTISEMPSHRHDYSGYTSNAGSHRHTGTTDPDGYARGGESASGSGKHVAKNDGYHSHTFTTNYAGDHRHYYSGNTKYQGGNAAHENRPPYYALAYIMKVA